MYASAQEFDVSEIETLFPATVPKPADKSGGRRKPLEPKPEIIQLVMLKIRLSTDIITCSFDFGHVLIIIK